jgi:hypothetical protein
VISRWQTAAVRWERLFADLDAQADADERLVLADEVRDRTRRELATLRLADRLRPAIGANLSLGVVGAGAVAGQLRGSGPDWLLLDVTGQPDALVALDAVTSVRGLPARSDAPGGAGPVLSRLGLGYALRGVARDRSPVTVWCRDGVRLTGTLDRVGADFVDLAEHPVGEPRRAGTVYGVATVPLVAIAVVRPG